MYHLFIMHFINCGQKLPASSQNGTNNKKHHKVLGQISVFPLKSTTSVSIPSALAWNISLVGAVSSLNQLSPIQTEGKKTKQNKNVWPVLIRPSPFTLPLLPPPPSLRPSTAGKLSSLPPAAAAAQTRGYVHYTLGKGIDSSHPLPRVVPPPLSISIPRGPLSLQRKSKKQSITVRRALL